MNAREHTPIQNATVLIVEHYPKINMKHSYKKASYSDTKSVLVYTCDEGGPTCIHKQYTSDLSTHNQYIKRGCPLLAKSSLKGDAADDSNSAYVKAPPQSVKNKKS